MEWYDIQLDIDDGNGKQIGSNSSLSCIGGRIEVSLIRFSLTRGWSGLSSSLTRWSWLGGHQVSFHFLPGEGQEGRSWSSQGWRVHSGGACRAVEGGGAVGQVVSSPPSPHLLRPSKPQTQDESFNDELWDHQWYLHDTRTNLRGLPDISLHVEV